jgi:hypothetical protein
MAYAADQLAHPRSRIARELALALQQGAHPAQDREPVANGLRCEPGPRLHRHVLEEVRLTELPQVARAEVGDQMVFDQPRASAAVLGLRVPS